jgi:hypothetical protein
MKGVLGGIYKLGCRCSERLRGKSGGGETLGHTRWSGGMGYLRRGKWIRDERFVSGRGLQQEKGRKKKGGEKKFSVSCARPE